VAEQATIEARIDIRASLMDRYDNIRFLFCGRYASRYSLVERGVFQKTIDLPAEWAKRYHFTLDQTKLATSRQDRVPAVRWTGRRFAG
jgi:hypothetical protein